MRKIAAPLGLALLCAGAFGCGSIPVVSELLGAAASPTFTPTDTLIPTATSTATPTPEPTFTPTTTPTPTEVPCPVAASGSEKTELRWFIGLGSGAAPEQLATEIAVVNAFNKSQDAIKLVLEAVEYDKAKDTLLAEIVSGDGPDIIGPVGFAGAHAFTGQWMDLTRLIACNNYDSSQFNPALMEMYHTSEGQVALPFAVYPSGVIYNRNLFVAAGLQYPPAKYGEQYRMPDGTLVEWSWDTLRDVSRLLTLDSRGRNANASNFDKENIVQYGFTWQWENHPQFWGSYWAGGSLLAPNGSKGKYTAIAPDAWKAAWEWTYDGMWGDQPFMGRSDVEMSKSFSSGNPFISRKVAMTVQPIWYTCCMGNVRSWDLAALPGYKGKVSGRIDEETFRVWKGTRHPQEAFTALTYLTGEAIKKLLIGGAGGAVLSAALPARTADQARWLANKKMVFPWVKDWEVVLAGLSYPDIPSAEAWMPNYDEAWLRGNTFTNLLRNTPGLDLDQEIQKYLSDLDVIFNK